MKKCLFILLASLGLSAYGQKSQMIIVNNAVGKLQEAINNKAEDKKQLTLITEGLKASESTIEDKKTKKYVETWAARAYLASFAALLEKDNNNSNRYFDIADAAINQATSLDRYEDNSGLIKASKHNLIIKRQERGTRFFFENNFDDAFTELKDVSDYFPKDSTLAANTGLCAFNSKQQNEALKYLERAKANHIRNTAVYQKLAELYINKFDSEKAIKTLEEGLVLNPGNSALTNDYINLLLDHERFERALSMINQELKSETRSKLLYYLFGYLQQVEQKNNETAILAYTKALDLDQNYFDALYQMSLAYINQANAVLNKPVANRDLNQYNALVNRAQFALQRANEINQNDKQTIQLLIDIYTRKNALDKVQELKRKLQEY